MPPGLPIRKYPQTYDYGFFGDDPVSPTFLYVINSEGKTVSRYVDPVTASTLIGSYLASNKKYWFGPTKFEIDPLLNIAGTGFAFAGGMDLTGLSGIELVGHPKSLIKLKAGTYAGGGSGMVFMFYMNGCSDIAFEKLNFDGNQSNISGVTYHGCIFFDTASGNNIAIRNNVMENAKHGIYGDPTEYKAGVIPPDTDYGTTIQGNTFRSCTYPINYHNGPSGSYIVQNVVKTATKGIFFDSHSDVIVSDNVLRNCAIGIEVYDGAWHCNIHDNIIYNSAGATALQLITTGGVKPVDAYIKVHHNHIHGAWTNGILCDGTDCEFTNNTLMGCTNPIVDTGVRTIIRNNQGYIAFGETRVIRGSIATLTENAFNSVDNPFGQNVALLSLDIYVSTGATATAPNIDCGIGSGATTDYTTLFDDLPGETIGFYRSTIATPGTQTVPQLWESGSGNRYLNMSIKDAAANGMIATYVATVMGI